VYLPNNAALSRQRQAWSKWKDSFDTRIAAEGIQAEQERIKRRDELKKMWIEKEKADKERCLKDFQETRERYEPELTELKNFRIYTPEFHEIAMKALQVREKEVREAYMHDLDCLRETHKAILAKIPLEDIAKKQDTVLNKANGAALGEHQNEQELFNPEDTEIELFQKLEIAIEKLKDRRHSVFEFREQMETRFDDEQQSPCW